MKRSFITIASVLLCTAALLQAHPAGTTDGAQARIDDGKGILREMESRAADAADQADRLDHYALDLRASRESHISAVNRLKDDINQMGSEVATLESNQASLAPWERIALFTAVPLIKDAASYANDEIRILREDAPFLWFTRAYHTDAERIHSDCAAAVRVISDQLKLVATDEKEQRLRQRVLQDGK